MTYTAEELAQHMENDYIEGWDDVPAMLRSQATEIARLRETLNKECDDGDELLRMLDLDPATYRTEGGRLNRLKIRAALAERKTPNV
jgi:hypothetical protein